MCFDWLFLDWLCQVVKRCPGNCIADSEYTSTGYRDYKGVVGFLSAQPPRSITSTCSAVVICQSCCQQHLVINKYIELLTEALEVNGLMQHLGQIFNCDETGSHWHISHQMSQHMPAKSIHMQSLQVTNPKLPSWLVLVLVATPSRL